MRHKYLVYALRTYVWKILGLGSVNIPFFLFQWWMYGQTPRWWILGAATLSASGFVYSVVVAALTMWRWHKIDRLYVRH